MEHILNYRQNDVSNNIIIFDTKRADVNGDGVAENIYLTGRRETTGIVASNIRVDVENGKTYHINLKVNKGYNPKLFVGDFTKDGIDDIFISIESGNTGRESYFYIYSFVDNEANRVFDFEQFNSEHQYDVNYKDNYIVEVKGLFSDFKQNINISNRGDYLKNLYNSDGKLINPMKGMVSPIIELRPIFSNGTYNLQAIQRIIGYYNADTLGMIVTPLHFDRTKNAFVSNTPYLI